ncbi:heterokaryon incompatibility protein-domain-containing protein [Stachybotrys elegans]|uniref:Heterokaryon incompatibility protein-domain-containing protein n=1 Tax=Stachybotrys elegans TaxID=80388 RepID=A0A8K0WN34_9HYPO|nr:heterokaryon incompatibility protein-domain-containing protein [Stachybotrys elegans]
MEGLQRLDIQSQDGVDIIYKDTSLLNPSIQEIRVIHLLSGSDDAPINCTLHKTALKAYPTPDYHALSYTWGDANDRREIILNGYVVTVTFNLYSALRRLRREEGTEVLWADAVCINQLDLDERAQQVGMMGEIYSLCTSTTVWLGEPSEEFMPTYANHWFGDERDDDSIAWLWDNFYDYATKPDFDVSDSSSVDWVFHGIAAIRMLSNGHLDDHPLFTDHTGDDFAYPLGYNEYCHQMAKALQPFIDSPWWTRVWTVQESTLPSAASLIYGPVSVDLSLLVNSFESLASHMLADCCSKNFSHSNPKMRSSIRKLGKEIKNIQLLRSSRQDGSTVELWEALVRFRERHATDDRDKIYGVLGMINAWPSEPVIPNYRTTAEKVYCEAALSTAMGKKSLLPLQYPLQRHMYPSLPSWALDWTAPSGLSDQVNMYQFTQDLFQLFKQTKEPCHIVPLANNSVLQVKGRRCDRIASVGALCWQNQSLAWSKEKRQTYCDWFRLAKLHEDPGRLYKTGCTYFEAFWRCLCWSLVLSMRSDGQAGHSKYSGTEPYEPFVAYCRSSLKSIFHPEGLSVEDRRAVLELEPRFAVPDDHKWNEHTASSFLAEQLINGLTVNTVMYVTEAGYLGIGPADTQVGDEVWCLFGGWMPFILRPTGEARELIEGEGEVPLWKVLGICYTHGIMNGEVADNEEIPIETLHLA